MACRNPCEHVGCCGLCSVLAARLWPVVVACWQQRVVCGGGGSLYLQGTKLVWWLLAHYTWLMKDELSPFMLQHGRHWPCVPGQREH